MLADVAMIAAAHEDLAVLAAEGRFRHDLYYRLIRDGVLVIPPLRERPEDVAILARQYVHVSGRASVRIEPDALDRLAEYDWPGNVRQLHTALRIALRLEPTTLTAESVERVVRGFGRAPAPTPPGPRRDEASRCRADAIGRCADSPGLGAHVQSGGFHAITASIQRRVLIQAYETAAGNKTAAGVLLGFHLSPGEEGVPGQVLTEGRRNLALRKFRYWCSRLGIAEALSRRPSTAIVASEADRR